MPDIIHTGVKEDSWDGYWSQRAINQQLDFCLSDGLLPVFQRYLPKNGLILEAGCGLGKWVVYFQRLGFKMIGLDSNLGCLNKIKEYDKTIKLAGGLVESLPLKDESLAAYISLGVIEHFLDGPMKALMEARRVLKSDGLAVIEVPCLNRLRKITLFFKLAYRWMRKKMNKEPRDYYFAEYRYSKRELEDFLKTAGLELIFSAPKDDTLPNRNIGLWLDFSFVRANGNNDPAHELNKIGRMLSGLLRFFSPWISCACVVCVARKSGKAAQDDF